MKIKKYNIIVCGYCGRVFLSEKFWNTDELVVIGTCAECYKQLKRSVKLKQLYKLKGNSIISEVEE